MAPRRRPSTTTRRDTADRDPLAMETRVTFFRSGGPGGQHRNKTSTAVRLHHLPTGLTVTATEERSQRQNRAIAFERLREKLRVLRTPRRPRIRTKQPAVSREIRLQTKRIQSTKKALRRPVDET